MKKHTTAAMLAAAAIMLAANPSFAAKSYNYYTKVSGKYAMMGDMDITNRLQVDSDDGYGFAGAIGTKMEAFRIEIELGTQKNDINALEVGDDKVAFAQSGDTRIDTALINAYFDIPLSGGFSLYAGGGAGAAMVTVNLYDLDSDDTVFAYKFEAGVSYAFTPQMGADLGYEYLATEDVELDHIEVKDISSNNVVLAFKYMF